VNKEFPVICWLFFLKSFYNEDYENRYFLTPGICLKNISEQIATYIPVTCCLSLAEQKSQRAKYVFISIAAGSTVLTNHQFSAFR
jgi:hypothetical protein